MSRNLSEITPNLVITNSGSPIESNNLDSRLTTLPTFPSYNGQLSLSGNKPIFIRRLHARLFINRVQASHYTPNFSNMTINYSGSNQTEEATFNKMSEITLNEAAIISDEISKWFSAAQRGLRVKVPHFEAESVNSHPQHSELALDQYYFTIDAGGSSVPRGFEI